MDDGGEIDLNEHRNQLDQTNTHTNRLYTGRDFCLWILTSDAAFTLLLIIFSGFEEPLTMIKIGAILTGIIAGVLYCGSTATPRTFRTWFNTLKPISETTSWSTSG